MSEFANQQVESHPILTDVYENTGVEKVPSDGTEKENTTSLDEATDDAEILTSAGNVIPMGKLKNGFFNAIGLVASTAVTVKDKAVEFSNSERAQSFKAKTIETTEKVIVKAKDAYSAAAPAIERARVAAVPYWEKTVEVTQKAAENIKPTAEKAYEKTMEVTQIAVENMKPVAEKVAIGASNGFKSISNVISGVGRNEPYAPSALDSATKGGTTYNV